MTKLCQDTKQQLQGRQSNLEYTLGVAEKFWDDVDNTLHALKDLLDSAASYDPPALDSAAQQAQQDHIKVTFGVCCYNG